MTNTTINHILKSDNILQINLEIGNIEYDAIIIKLCCSIQLDILATSEGHIKKDQVYINKQIQVIKLDLINPLENIDCVISYFKNGSLINYNSFLINMSNQFETSKYNFNKKLSSPNSDWRLKLSINNEKILVTVLKNGNTTNAVFGNMNKNIDRNDYIMTLYPWMKSFIIPPEIIQNKIFKTDESVACFVLQKADYHSVEVLYKNIISNPIKVKDLPKKYKNRDY